MEGTKVLFAKAEIWALVGFLLSFVSAAASCALPRVQIALPFARKAALVIAGVDVLVLLLLLPPHAATVPTISMVAIVQLVSLLGSGTLRFAKVSW